MGKKERNKGKRGELELAHKLSKLFGIVAKRGNQYKGSPDSPDVVALSGIHVECKRVEKFQLYPSLEQSANDSGENIPVVMHRRNRKKWVIALYLDDLPELARIVNEQQKPPV